MKIHSTNYFDTFIEVAEDCPAENGQVPPNKNGGKSIAEIQFERIQSHPYKFNSDEVLFDVFAERKDLTASEYDAAKQEFFSKGQACFRASPLTKRYGFGVHANSEGKIAIFGKETEEYAAFLINPTVKKVKAMRSSKN